MKKITLTILFIASSLFAAEESSSYIVPAVTTVNTGVERMWVWSGVSGGFLVGKQRLGGELYYWNREESAPGTTLNNNLHLFGTAYVHWEYQFLNLRCVRLSGGISLGYQYAEVDRNWDSTYIHNAVINNSDTLYGTIPLNWEAESKIQSFGGPQATLGAGWKRLFLTCRFRLNFGNYKRWGGYTSNDQSVTAIDCGEGLSVGKVQVSNAGWQGSSSGILETGFSLLPEWQFGAMILF